MSSELNSNPFTTKNSWRNFVSFVIGRDSEGCIVGCAEGVRVGAGDIVGAGVGWTVGDPEGLIDFEGDIVGGNVGFVVGVAVVGTGVGIILELSVPAGATGPTGTSVGAGSMITGTKELLNMVGTVVVLVTFCVCARTTEGSP